MSIRCNNRSCGSERDLKLHKLLLKKEYSLNAVNNYGDSLLHVSAAYGCTLSVKTIIEQNKNSIDIDRKNKFGWTPLMHAIRANNIETVKILLENGANVAQRTYLGISTLTLAAGMGLEMFKTIYKACPTLLESSSDDDITPLCVAAMKNDKILFFKLVSLGLQPKNESIYTHMVMRESVFPEIQDLAEKQTDIESYWNDQPDNIQIIDRKFRCEDVDVKDSLNPVYNKRANNSQPPIFVDSPEAVATNLISKSLNNRREPKLPNLDLLCLKEAHFRDSQSISPNLIYNLDTWFEKSPNPFYSSNQISLCAPKQISIQNSDQKSSMQKQQLQQNIFMFDHCGASHRTPDNQSSGSGFEAENQSTDHNMSFTFVPEFSPSKSPYLPSDYEDEDVCGEDTPTPPHYKTPPQGMVLNSEQAKLVIVLKQFDLAHHISTFLKEEVDMNLFVTLNDQDLKEIGIANEQDRKTLLAVIDGYMKDEKY